MKKVFIFTLEQEQAIKNLLEVLKEENIPEQIVELMNNMQEKFIAVLSEAAKSEQAFPTYPEINYQEIVGDNALWLIALEKLSEQPLSAKTLNVLWSLVAVHKKMEELYREASKNAPRPLTKIFFNSLVELKSLCLAKIMQAVDILQNKVWQEVEFSPFKVN